MIAALFINSSKLTDNSSIEVGSNLCKADNNYPHFTVVSTWYFVWHIKHMKSATFILSLYIQHYPQSSQELIKLSYKWANLQLKFRHKIAQNFICCTFNVGAIK